MPRSGSHYLRAAIDGGGGIVNLDEPFNPDLGDRPYRFDRFLRSRIVADPSWRMDAECADAVVAQYFDRLVREGDGRPVLVDIKDDQLRILDWPATGASSEPRVMRHILKSGYRIVRLERRDLLAQYASVRRAVKTGEWVLADGAQPGAMSLRLEYERTRRHIAMTGETGHDIRRWIRNHPAVLSLTYETMFANDRLTEAARSGLTAFLGAPVVEDGNRMPRKLAPPLDRLVANLPEIRARLADEGLAWLCDLEAEGFSSDALAKTVAPPSTL